MISKKLCLKMYENKSYNLFFKICFIYFVLVLIVTIDADVYKTRVLRSVGDDYDYDLKDFYDNQLEVPVEKSMDVFEGGNDILYTDINYAEDANMNKIPTRTTVLDEEYKHEELIRSKSRKTKSTRIVVTDYEEEIDKLKNKVIKSSSDEDDSYTTEKFDNSIYKAKTSTTYANIGYAEEINKSGSKITKSTTDKELEYTTKNIVSSKGKKNKSTRKPYYYSNNRYELGKSRNQGTTSTTYASLDSGEDIDKSGNKITKSTTDKGLEYTTEDIVRSKGIKTKRKKTKSTRKPYYYSNNRYELGKSRNKGITSTTYTSLDYGEDIDKSGKNITKSTTDKGLEYTTEGIVRSKGIKTKSKNNKSTRKPYYEYYSNDRYELGKSRNKGTTSTTYASLDYGKDIDKSGNKITKSTTDKRLEYTTEDIVRSKSIKAISKKTKSTRKPYYYGKDRYELGKSRNKGTTSITNASLDYEDVINESVSEITKSTANKDVEYTTKEIIRSRSENRTPYKNNKYEKGNGKEERTNSTAGARIDYKEKIEKFRHKIKTSSTDKYDGYIVEIIDKFKNRQTKSTENPYLDYTEQIDESEKKISKSFRYTTGEIVRSKSEKTKSTKIPYKNSRYGIVTSKKKETRSTSEADLIYAEEKNKSVKSFTDRNKGYTTKKTVKSRYNGTKITTDTYLDYTEEKDATRNLITKSKKFEDEAFSVLDILTSKTTKNNDILDILAYNTNEILKNQKNGTKSYKDAVLDYAEEQTNKTRIITYEDINYTNNELNTNKSGGTKTNKILDKEYREKDIESKKNVTKNIANEEIVRTINSDDNSTNQMNKSQNKGIKPTTDIYLDHLNEEIATEIVIDEKYNKQIFNIENIGNESTTDAYLDYLYKEIATEIFKDENNNKEIFKIKNQGNESSTPKYKKIIINIERIESITYAYSNHTSDEIARTTILDKNYTEGKVQSERKGTISTTEFHDSNRTENSLIRPIILRDEDDTREGICRQDERYTEYVKHLSHNILWDEDHEYSKTVTEYYDRKYNYYYESYGVNYSTIRTHHSDWFKVNDIKNIYNTYDNPPFKNEYKKCSFNKKFECVRHTFHGEPYYRKELRWRTIDVCCQGYMENKLRPFDEKGRILCAPICDPPCVMATCTRGRKCTCLPRYTMKKYSTNICLPICWGNCGGRARGECIAPNICLCNRGFKNKEGNLRRCVTHCPTACINSVCTGPSTCKCFSGYMRNATYKHICEPICKKSCTHGECVAPNRCLCDEGYTFKYGTCYAICDKYCGRNGTCIHNDTSLNCVCDPGYEFDTRIEECVPRCENCSVSGFCVAPNKCTCLPGHMSTKEGGCVFSCSFECGLGRCIRPDVCLCPKGYIFNKTAVGPKCVPFCRGCELGTCISPKNCQCPKGYVYHVPKIGEDRRIKCIKTVKSYRYYDDKECKSVYDYVKRMKERRILMEKIRIAKLKWEEDRKKRKEEYEQKVFRDKKKKEREHDLYVRGKAQRRKLKKQWLKAQNIYNQQRIEKEKEEDERIRKMYDEYRRNIEEKNEPTVTWRNYARVVIASLFLGPLGIVFW